MDDKVRQEDEMVIEALRGAGVHVNSSQDLMNERTPAAAVPVLLEALRAVKTFQLKKIIVRSLGDRSAKGKAEPGLLEAFEESLPDSSVDAKAFRWAIANSLELIGGKANADDLWRLLNDPRTDNERGMLCLVAAKTKDQRFVPLFLSYLDSEICLGFAACGLGILRAQEAVPKLESLAATTKNSWVRREAKTALKRIAAASGQK